MTTISNLATSDPVSKPRPRLVISRRIFEESITALKPHFDLIHNQDDLVLKPDQLVARALGADALFVVASDRIDTGFLSAIPTLKMIATGSVGSNHIDLEYCAKHDVLVSNTPDVLTQATADLAWALLMAAARRVTESEQWLRSGHWDRWAFEQFLGKPVYGATLGIVGMGRIGCAIAQRAQGFSMPIVYHNRSPSPTAQSLGARWVSKEDLLAQADFVMLVLPYSAQSHHWLDARALGQLKPNAIIVNIARGGIVDDTALAQALAQGRLAGAGLDVYENEPLVNPALLALKQVVLTPHIGSATTNSRLAMSMLATDNLIAWAQGKPLLTAILK